MAVTVTINNKSFEIPEAGDQNYAEDLTNYLVEIATVLNSVQGPLDIIETDFSFVNNQATPADVTGLVFTTTSIAGFICDYIITRDDGTTKISEKGQLIGVQGTGGWELARGNVINDVDNTNFPGSNGDIGVEFSITSSGQVQYTSNDYTGQISGVITFTAKSISQ